MMPPTPTPVPVGTAIPLGFQNSLWDYAPNVIGLWNTLDDYTPAFQLIIVGLLLIGLVWLGAKMMRSLSEEEA